MHLKKLNIHLIPDLNHEKDVVKCNEKVRSSQKLYLLKYSKIINLDV